MPVPALSIRPARFRLPHRLRRRATLLCLALAIGACGSDSLPGLPGLPGLPDNRDAKTFLLEYLRDWYLWEDQLPASVDPDDYASDKALLDGLRIAQDTFSYISDAVSYNRFFDGETIGFGIHYRVRANDLLLLMVQPQSPAARAGLRRGQTITAIQGESIAALATRDGVSDAFGPTDEGIVRRFDVLDDGTARQIEVTKALYPLTYVLAENLFEQTGRKIGYVNFYSFADGGVTPWQAALDRLLAQGAQDLIVDLRTNGGGLLSTAAQVGSALADVSGQPMSELQFNRLHRNSDRTIRFTSDPRAGRFNRLVWLTSDQTCSASEALIQGLAPYRAATRIGTTTCGKPVGFTPQTHKDKVYSIVTFRLRNASGATDYFDGLPADCPVPDNGVGQFGQADEPLTAAALAWLQSGQCPAAAGQAGKAGKASTRTRPPPGFSNLR
ncbi:MAG: S41 family peptidase [Burkholderiaceae bacterium]